MRKLLFISAVTAYVLILITFHRFEDSKYAIDIFSSISSVVASIATAGAFAIAAKTYIKTTAKAESNSAFAAYNETLENLIHILSNQEYDKSYKLYHSALSFDAIVKIEKLVTENEHKAILEAKHIILKHHIEQMFLLFDINDYFCSEIETESYYYYSVSKAADDMCSFWQENISGKSNLAKRTDNKVDSFSCSPYGIDDVLLVKTIALYSGHVSKIKDAAKNIDNVVPKHLTDSPHPLIKITEKLAMPIAYLLLRKQTESFIKEDKIYLKLKNTVDDEYWLTYKTSFGSVSETIPEYFLANN